MKNVLFILISLITVGSFAQKEKYDDLLVLFADGNYEKLVKSAEKYTLNDNTKKDPLPYLWMSKGLYEMSKDAKYTSDETFKNAYKDAISAAGKFLRYDKEGDYTEEGSDFIYKLKGSLIEVIENELSTKNYPRAYGWVLKMKKLAPEDAGNTYLEGTCQYQKGDKSGATLTWKEADAMLAKITSVDDWHKEDFQLLKIGVFGTAQCYIDSRREEMAKALLNKVKQWFEDDDDFKAKYDEIVN
jgi:hypothetical protein